MTRAARLRIALALGTALAASACQTTAPVDRPCGVITDSLLSVRGATPADTRRIDIHFERGVAAGCWRR
ncbi:hypothetical protein [Bosea sp. 685]|uniref:hypothetical protein n=1 Tax=Bosea sp. 685 TaxID=3080057 RepID=UPI0028933623|nr:hypothetical protein [Bosea sp. 685]WNJ88452.1 hypothetical protein RMR04_18780 [Bosea sp. 685]